MSPISWFKCPSIIFALRKALVLNFFETSELTRYRRVQCNKVRHNDNATHDWRFPSELCYFDHNKRPTTVHTVAQTINKYFETWHFLRKFARGYRNIFITSSNLSTIVIRCQFKRALARRSRAFLFFSFSFFLTKNKVVNNYTLSKFAIFYASSFISIRAFVIFTGWR